MTPRQRIDYSAIVDRPPLYAKGVADHADPLPQALVLTAIVISFGMTAVVVMMSLGAFIEVGDDRVNMPESDRIMPPLKTVDETANEDEKA